MSFYLKHRHLHKFPKFTANAASIQVGTGQHCAILFVVPHTAPIHGLHFEIFTLIFKRNQLIDLEFGSKSLFQIEAELNNRKYVTFLNRLIPTKAYRRRINKGEIPFVEGLLR